MVENTKLNKDAKHALDLSLVILEHAMELALQKEDLDAIIAISDRMMMLYQHLADKNVKKFKPGFGLPVSKKEATEDDESDER
jgi:hypothetical protein